MTKPSSKGRTVEGTTRIKMGKKLIKDIDQLFPQWVVVTSDKIWYGEVIGPIKELIRKEAIGSFTGNANKIKI